MPNQVLLTRLEGIRQALMANCASGGEMSSATRGREREIFIDGFLSRVLPPAYRFGTGDATDATGARSGQLDVVVEYSMLPSLPAVGGEPRLYMAEGIAAIVEVKSDVAGQWGEVVHTATSLHRITRQYLGTMTVGGGAPSEKIPVIAVGYRGWKTVDTIAQHVARGPVSGILVLEDGLFVGGGGLAYPVVATGAAALWAVIANLHQLASALASAWVDTPMYVQ